MTTYFGLLCAVLVVALVRPSGASRQAISPGSMAPGAGPAPANISIVSKNWFQDGACKIGDLLTEFSGGCVWGQNCGSSCAPYELYGTERYDDELDKACLEHDICLCDARTVSERRTCDSTLKNTALRIAEENDECTGLNNLNPFCQNDDIVCAAYNIKDAMILQGSGDKIKYNCYNNQQQTGGYEDDEEYQDDVEEPEVIPQAPEEPEEIFKFNFEMDWNPSSCFGDSECSESKQIHAFTVDQMNARLVDRQSKNIRCMDKDSEEAKNLQVSSQVSQGTLRALQCIYQNAAGENEELWRSMYLNTGSCTGLSVPEYFDVIVKRYNEVNLNKIIYDMGITNGTAVVKQEVDRDTLLDTVSAAIGKKAWVECNPDLMMLRVVLVCISPNAPYDIIDCTMDREDPTSTNGIPCDGMLKLPTVSGGGFVSEQCQPYIPYGVSKSGIAQDEGTPPVPTETVLTLPPVTASPDPVTPQPDDASKNSGQQEDLPQSLDPLETSGAYMTIVLSISMAVATAVLFE